MLEETANKNEQNRQTGNIWHKQKNEDAQHNDLSDEQHRLSTLRLVDFVIISSSHTTFLSDNNTRTPYHV